MDGNGLGLTLIWIFKYVTAIVYGCSEINKWITLELLITEGRWPLLGVKSIYFSFYSNAKFKYMTIWYSELIEKTRSLIRPDSEEVLMREMSFCRWDETRPMSIFSSVLYWWLTVCIKIDSLQLKTLNLCLYRIGNRFFLLLVDFFTPRKKHSKCTFDAPLFSDFIRSVVFFRSCDWNSETAPYLKSKYNRIPLSDIY